MTTKVNASSKLTVIVAGLNASEAAARGVVDATQKGLFPSKDARYFISIS